MNREDKSVVVGDLKDKFSRAKGAFLTGFTGMPVMSLFKLRQKVHGAGGHYQVIKNTLARLGTVGTPYEEVTKTLKGAVGWVITEGDPVAVAKVLKDFAKDNEVFLINRGVVEGIILSVEEVNALADLPPKDVLRAQLLGLLCTPARQLVTVIQATPRQLASIIQTYSKKKEEESKNV